MNEHGHHALVIPMSDGYAVSCSCGWIGGSHESEGPAEREARDHERAPDDTEQSEATLGKQPTHG